MKDLHITTIGATEMRANISDALNSVDDERNILLIKRRNKADAALINLDLLEDLLALQSKQYVESIRESRQQIKRGEVFTMDEVFGDV